MAWMAECVGGPLDGERIEVVGEIFQYLEYSNPVMDLYAQEIPPVPEVVSIGHYKLSRGDDGQFLYIHVEHPK